MILDPAQTVIVNNFNYLKQKAEIIQMPNYMIHALMQKIYSGTCKPGLSSLIMFKAVLPCFFAFNVQNHLYKFSDCQNKKCWMCGSLFDETI